MSQSAKNDSLAKQYGLVSIVQAWRRDSKSHLLKITHLKNLIIYISQFFQVMKIINHEAFFSKFFKFKYIVEFFLVS
jgi:hypothetical protein